MNVLIDTHTLLWHHFGHPRLSAVATATLAHANNSFFVSAASHWEIAIKVSTGKLKLRASFPDFIQVAIIDQGYTFVPVETRHSAVIALLPFVTKHRDPFDRMLVAQVQTDGYRLLSADTQLDAYGITRLW